MFAEIDGKGCEMVQTRATDEYEQRLLDDVEEHGWHLIAVGDDPRGPSFVYSVGFFDTLGHPELILFGFDSIETMGGIINGIGALIKEGNQFKNGSRTDLLLENYPCRFRDVPKEVYPDYLGYAMWYYRPEGFPAIQCFWPDRAGLFPWEPGCDASTRLRQPILVHLRGWRFYEPKEQAVFTTRHVREGTLPILRVARYSDGDWQFLCGTPFDPEDALIVRLESIVEINPRIDELADLPEGWCAVRESPSSPWVRSPLD